MDVEGVTGLAVTAPDEVRAAAEGAALAAPERTRSCAVVQRISRSPLARDNRLARQRTCQYFSKALLRKKGDAGHPDRAAAVGGAPVHGAGTVADGPARSG